MKENMKDIVTIVLTLIVGVILYKFVGWTFRLLWMGVMFLVAYFIVTNFIIKRDDKDAKKDNIDFDF